MREKLKNMVKKMLTPVLNLLLVLNVSPTFLTFLGLIFSFIPAFFYIKGNFILGGIFLLIFSLFDTLDGTLARIKGEETNFGAFIDSVTDRIQEGVIFVSLIYFYREYLWIVIVLFLSFLFSFSISYTRARAEGLNFNIKKGPMERPERILFLSFSSFFGKNIFPYFLILFLILVFFTFLRRVFEAYKLMKSEEKNKGSNPFK